MHGRKFPSLNHCNFVVLPQLAPPGKHADSESSNKFISCLSQPAKLSASIHTTLPSFETPTTTSSHRPLPHPPARGCLLSVQESTLVTIFSKAPASVVRKLRPRAKVRWRRQDPASSPVLVSGWGEGCYKNSVASNNRNVFTALEIEGASGCWQGHACKGGPPGLLQLLEAPGAPLLMAALGQPASGPTFPGRCLSSFSVSFLCIFSPFYKDTCHRV